jgi:hypothetical protein
MQVASVDVAMFDQHWTRSRSWGDMRPLGRSTARTRTLGHVQISSVRIQP